MVAKVGRSGEGSTSAGNSTGDSEDEEERNGKKKQKKKRGNQASQSNDQKATVVQVPPVAAVKLDDDYITKLIEEGVRKALARGEPPVRRDRVVVQQRKYWCDFCKTSTHDTENCFTKQRVDRYNAKKAQEEAAKKARDDRPGTSGGDGGMAKVSQIGEYEVDEDLLFAPAIIAGQFFRRCLIDTGATSNLLPHREAVRYGIAFDPCAIKRIMGFNGATSQVEGGTYCEVNMSPCTEAVSTLFLVTKGLSGFPILGLPALSALGLSVDCGKRELVDKETGRMARCSAAFKLRRN